MYKKGPSLAGKTRHLKIERGRKNKKFTQMTVKRVITKKQSI